ncbi:MAG TPA: ParB/RepB/Spo0J family partition protein, partial [Pyrinomonadaceae bacterium]|nr:ParB/RepB/Spo0J family partition protein [Pyrinomonadaceae bacterium]
MNRKALGRGLGALLSSDRAFDLQDNPNEVDIDLIDRNPAQPRAAFDLESLNSLAESVKVHGVVQPLLVRRVGQRYELVAGERRWRAAKAAGLAKIPVLVKDVADGDLLEVALVENVLREDLNPIEEAQAYRNLIDKVGMTQESLGERFGRDRSYITNYLRLLRLPDDLQQLVKEKRLSTGHARTLLGLEDVDQQRRVARQVIQNDLSVRATESLVKAMGSTAKGRSAGRNVREVDPNVRAAETK